jgi:glycosyltransferase involved in cell wall biosynthesis
LSQLLGELQSLKTENLFKFSVVIVDNDKERSGYEAVSGLKNNVKLSITCDVEPRRSISYARNKSVQMAKGNLIAFIDDDEFPDNNWLVEMYMTLQKKGVDGVLGPVKPHFATTPPTWLLKSKILERKSFQTGTVIHDSKYTRTGNVLIRKELFKSEDDYFDPKFGLTGGGDAVFFKRMIEKGKTFVWCDEGIVYETVPSERQTRSYYIKRALTRGMTDASHISFFSLSTLKSIVALIVYTLALPILFLIGEHLFIKYLIKDFDHLGKLSAYLGIKFVKERPYFNT